VNSSSRTFLFSLISILISGCTVVEHLASESSYRFDAGDILVANDSVQCRIAVFGSITADTVRAFRLAVNDANGRNCRERWVMLHSQGGGVLPAIDIGEIVRKSNYNTEVISEGICHSACGLIFISGIKREAPVAFLGSASMGFHQVFTVDSGGNRTCQTRDSYAAAEIGAFSKKMLPNEAAKQFYSNVMETDCSRIKLFTPAELVKSGIATGTNNLQLL
jgi:hypothetical protein